MASLSPLDLVEMVIENEIVIVIENEIVNVEIVIENVGNLVCPAELDVGEHARAMVFSVTEGEEKPLEYPVMFRSADMVVVNKVDLLPYLDFDLDLDLFLSNLADVNPGATVIRTSARTGEGLDGWCSWLRDLATGSRAVSSADGARWLGDRGSHWEL